MVVPVVTTTYNALMYCDGSGYDWSDQAEEGPTNFTLMAYSFTSSNSEVSTDSNCSSSCLENVKILKEQNEQLLKDLRTSKLNAITYKTSLESVEARLLVYKKMSLSMRKISRYNDVPPPYKGNFMRPKPNLSFSGLEEFVNEPIVNESTVKKPVVETIKAKASADKPKAVKKNNGALIIEDWVSDSEEEDVPQAKKEKKTVKSSFAKIEFVKSKEQVKSPRKIAVKQGSNFKMINKACCVCVSFDHLQYDCDNHQRQFNNKRMVKPVWNYTQRVNHQNFSRMTHSNPKKNMVPKAVLMRSGLVSLTTTRPVNTAQPKTIVNSARPMKNVFNKAHSTVRRPINNKTTTKNNNFNQRVNSVSGKNVTTARPKAVVNTARPKTVHNVVKGNQCINHSEKGNPQMDLQDQEVIDSGCSRHKIGNMSYLTDFEEIDERYVAFGGNSKEGKITGRGTIKTGNLDFENVYFVRELQFNLFSVSQMCDKKNSVLFNDTECIILSPNFKLTDESHVLLKVPRKNNMHSVDLKNIVPKGGLTCLFAKVTSDESKLWHRRLGHINFKTMNKLVKENLIRGLPLKLFENDQTYVACQKGKQHRAFSLGFMRPFGCPVTILNTIDHLGKFDGKADEGFFVGYSINSKAFRVFNNRTRIVKENMHVQFSENIPNIIGSGPNWLFDIDALTKSMNYKPVVAGNQSNGNAGTKACDDAGKARMETIPGKDYILLPLWTADPPFSQSSKSSPNAGFKPLGDDGKKVDENPRKESESNDQEKEDNFNSTNNVNAASTNEVNAVGTKTSIKLSLDPNMPELEDIIYSDNDEDVSAEGDMTIWMHLYLYTQEEGIEYDEVFAPVARIEAISLFLAYASFKDFVMYKMDVKSAFLYGFKEVKLTRLCLSEGTKILKKFGFIDVKTTSRPMKTQKPLLKDEDCEEVDVHLYRSMIGSLMHLTSSRPDIMYLKGQPKLGLWYLKDSHFDLVAYTDSDCAGASLARKSTTGALVDAKKVIITESTIRRDLQLDDAEGIDCLPNDAIFEQLTLMGKQRPRKPKRKDIEVPQPSGSPNIVADKAVNEEMDDSLERAVTTATSLDAEQDR
ncbi:ribonuclease H-like domain-containing protein, partial [Tanacetum coccineum]